MSRVGNKPVPIPSGVDVRVEGLAVTVKGPRGELSQSFHPEMSIATRQRDRGSHKTERLGRSQGAARADAQPYQQHGGRRKRRLQREVLDLVGVGYRVAQNGKGITLSVMLSHQVNIDPPQSVTLTVEGNNRIRVQGIDKQAVGQIAAEIRKVRPPNVYTGKGIRYANEVVHLKPGKSARRA